MDMKGLRQILMTVAAAALATACSRDGLPGDGSTDVAVTFTATVEHAIAAEVGGTMRETEPTAATRATADVDDSPTRFYAQAVSDGGTLSDVAAGAPNGDGSYSFTLQVAPDTEYTYMFWADNADGSATPADLRRVPYAMGSIAFAAKAEGTVEAVDGTEVKLEHVVTKVSLQHNGANPFSSNAGDVMTAALPCATTYDISQQTASGSGTYEFAHTFAEAAQVTGATDFCSFYVLPPSNADNSVDITFHNYGMTISNISMPANAHITLSGDFSSQNDKWEVTEAIRREILHTFLL